MGTSLIPVHPGVFQYPDCVNVYLIRQGSKALLIDFGSGAVLDALHELPGVEVDYILHTHYHRDQCAGDARAISASIPIVVPHAEARLFEDATTFWETRTFYDLYYFKPTFFVSTHDIPVAQTLRDKSVFKWEGLDILAIQTPGHTTGSLTYLVEMDGTRLAFTGDLLHARGKVWTYYDLEYVYNDNGEGGIRRTLKSCKRLLAQKPDLLLPSHGPVIENPESTIKILEQKLKRARYVFGSKRSSVKPIDSVFRFLKKRLPAVNIERVFPSLVQQKFIYGRKTTYLLKGIDGHCIMIDFGGIDDVTTLGERGLEKLMQKHGLHTIDFLIPTHYHDDHVGGIPLLQSKCGIPVWALEEMVDVLEHPTHYRLGCLIDQPIQVGRVLKDGEIFRWNAGDQEFQVFHFPGQTEYHMALLGTIDAHRVLFTGDSITEWFFSHRVTNVNCLNWCRLGAGVGYQKCARVLRETDPEYLAISHYGIVKVTGDMIDQFAAIVTDYEPTVAELVPDENPNFGFDPYWCSFRPVYVRSPPGELFESSLVVRNYLDRPVEVGYSLNLPVGWEAVPNKFTLKIEAGEFLTHPIHFQPTREGVRNERVVITADITFDGKSLGPVPDMVVDQGFIPPKVWKGWTPAQGKQSRRMMAHTRLAKRFFRV